MGLWKESGLFKLQMFVMDTQPSIAHYLKLLIDCKLVTSDKEGRNVRYYLNNKMLDDYIAFVETLKL